MSAILGKMKQTLTKGCIDAVYYSPMLRLMNRASNTFTLQRRSDGRIGFPFVKKRTAKNVQVLAYHRVNDVRDPYFPGMPVAVFASHMEYLAAHYTVLPLEELVERMQRNDVPDNAVAITFDDGYRDVYLQAFPILKKLALPATVFLATCCIEGTQVLWHDKVFESFRTTQEPSLAHYGPEGRTFALRTVEERLAAQQAVLRFLRNLDEAERLKWIEHLVTKLFPEEEKTFSETMLTWEDIAHMHRERIAFGSHTITHPIMSKVSVEQARWEICESKRTIEQQVGSVVRSFAYPNGSRADFNDTTKELLREAGYACAVTTIFGTNSAGDDLFALRRGQPWEADLPTFATKLKWYKFCA